MSSYPFIGPCPKCGGDYRYRWVHSFCGGSLSINEYKDSLFFGLKSKIESINTCKL